MEYLCDTIVDYDDLVIPAEIIEMIAEIDPKPWYYVNKWYSRFLSQQLMKTIELHEAKPSLNPKDHSIILRIFVNMCRYDVFDESAIRRVMKLIMGKYNGYTHALIFFAIAYHKSTHLVDLMPRLGDEFNITYDRIHELMGYRVQDKTYDIRNDIIIEFAASRPDSVDFIAHYIKSWYNIQYAYYGTKPYQFRDCIDAIMGENIYKLYKKKLCELPNTRIPSMGYMWINISKGMCKTEIDKNHAFGKSISALKLLRGSSTHISLLHYVYTYFVETVLKYSQSL